MSGEPSATQARAAPPGSGEGAGARPDRRGRVGPEERHRLRGTFGFALYSARSRRGWPLEVLAKRAGVSETTVRHLEQGHVRPSDDMCTRLARALREGRDELSVAICDVQLRRAAGPSLRPWQRRHGPRGAAAKVYAAALAEAHHLVDGGEVEPLGGAHPTTAVFLVEFEAALTGRSPSPAEAHPRRWPRVRQRASAN